MSYLVIELDEAPDKITVQIAGGDEQVLERDQGGVFVVPVAEEDLDGPMKITADTRSLELTSDVLRSHFAASEASARPVVVTGVDVPTASSFQTRVDPDRVARLAPDAAIAAGPGTTPLPINSVGQKETTRYLSIPDGLGSDEFAYGQLREFETYWEPLGWALDEWIDTLSLAPFEDTVQSGAEVANDAQRQTGSEAGAESDAFAQTGSEVASHETLRSATSGTASGRGFSASVQGPAALANGLLGGLKLAFNNAQTVVTGAVTSDLGKDVVSRLEQTTSQERHANNESLARVANAWRESRRIRALRNLSEGRTENIALYSVVRQWLVSTVESPTKRIVLVKIHEVGKPFDQADLVAHRAVLLAGLLDPTLEAPLTAAASAAPVRPSAPAEPDVTAEKVTGTLLIIDPAKGPESRIVVTALFSRDDDASDEALSVKLVADREGVVPFELPLEGRPLRKLAGWRFEFSNPKWFKADQLAIASPRDVTIVTSGEPIDVTLDPDIRLSPHNPRTFPRGFDNPHPNPAEQAAGTNLARALAHLNANRPYYRTLIDLAADPVTRFVRLTERQPRPPMPADMEPLGIAGAHLAFLTDEKPTAPTQREPIKRVLSTPAGGTFVEVIEGQTEIKAATKTKGWPAVALGPNETISWPSALSLPEVRDATAAAAGEDAAAAAPPPDPTAELPAKLDGIAKTLATLKSALDALKPEAPTLPDDKKDTTTEDKPAAGADGPATQAAKN